MRDQHLFSFWNALVLQWRGCVLVVLSLLLAGEALGQPWGQFRHDAARSGRSPNGGVNQSWTFTPDNFLSSSAVVGDNGTIYIGGQNAVYALDPDGTRQWRAALPGSVGTDPTVGSDGTIYVGVTFEAPGLYALNPDGSEKWSFLPESDVRSTPAIGADGTIYFGTDNGTFYALSPSGEIQWTFQTGSAVNTAPALGADGTVYVSAGGQLYALAPDGSLRWENAPGGGAPAIGPNGTVYVVEGGEQLHAIDPDQGTVNWTFTGANFLSTSPAVGGDGTIYVAGSDASSNLTLFAIDANGSQEWSFLLQGDDLTVAAPALGSDGVIYMGTSREIYAVNSNGTQRWRTDRFSVFDPPSLAGDGTLYLPESNLYAVRGPRLQVVPTALEFGGVPVDSTADENIEITNTGDVNLSVTDLTFEGPDASAFSMVSSLDGSIAPGSTATAAVRFGPEEAASQTATLAVESNAGTQEVSLSGTGQASELQVAPAALEFGEVAVGTQVDTTVALTNAGNAELEVTGVTISGANSFSRGRGGTGTLAPEETREVVVRFAPQEAGAQTGTLTIESDAGTVDVSLSGTGQQSQQVDVRPASPPQTGSQFDLTASLPSDFEAAQGELFYRRGGETEYASTAFAREDTSLRATIPAEAVTLRGVEYYARFTSAQRTLTVPAVDPENNPLHEHVTSEQVTTDAISLAPRTYSMVSIPLSAEDASIGAILEDDYGESAPDQWRLLRWNSGSEQYQQFPELDAAFTPGTAFWLITQSGEPFDVEQVRSVDASEPFALTLDPGWNQIGNPFPFPVAWEDVDRGGSVDAPVRYAGGQDPWRYNQQRLQPWEGYFVYNGSAEPVTLTIPPIEAASNAGKRSTASPAVQGEYVIQLRADQKEHRLADYQNFVGFSETARPGRDAVDFAEVPGIGNRVRLSIMEDDERLAGSFKPTSSDGQWWDLEASLTLDGKPPAERTPVTVTLSSQDRLPDDFRYYVVDKEAGYMRQVEQQTFTVTLDRTTPTRRLRLIVGTPAFAEGHSAGASLAPGENALLPNYPNPFSGETTIQYKLREPARVTLEVYNVLGQRVRTLVEAKQGAGVHSVRWRGRDEQGGELADGMYICRLKAGSFSASRQMILLR